MTRRFKGDANQVSRPASELPLWQGAPPRRDDTREAYWAWRRTDEGRAAWAYFQHHAFRMKEEGATRIAVHFLIQMYRNEVKRKITNTWQPYIADEMAERWPELGKLIERHKRKRVS